MSTKTDETTTNIGISVGKLSFLVEGVPTEMKNGNKIIHSSNLEQAQLLIALKLVELNILSGPAFLFIRKTLGLSRLALANFLNCPAETFLRWEREEKPQAQLAFLLLFFCVEQMALGNTEFLEYIKNPGAVSVTPQDAHNADSIKSFRIEFTRRA
ncbi:MAG: hypothetical protein HYT94_00075 [Parcubacteria group bacterium]|nr:hypothetical protein [Parcubacteria group bacterium]